MIGDKTSQNNAKRICIVNNYNFDFKTDRVSRIESIIREYFPDSHVEIVHYSQIDIELLKKSAGIILTGSLIDVSNFYNNPYLEKKFNPEIKLIQETNQIPLLSICYGHQLTAHAFGGHVKRMKVSRAYGTIISLSLNKTDELIPYNKIPVDIQHHDYVSVDDAQVQKNFEIIATYERNGYRTIQYMRHVKKPIYSVQFHPETHQITYKYKNKYDEDLIHKTRTIGEEIIKNFVLLCIRSFK